MKIRILTAMAFMVSPVVLTDCDSSKSKTPSVESAASHTVGSSDPKAHSSVLFRVAGDKGHFSGHDLKLGAESYQSSLSTSRDLPSTKVDLRLASDVVAARSILKRSDLRIIFSLGECDDTNLLTLEDHGIVQVPDIRPKTIGSLCGSAGEFYLDLLMASLG